MKRSHFLVLVTLMVLLPVSSWPDLPQVNSYGIFRDNRFPDPFLRAYWFGQGGPSEILVGVRSINLSTNQSLNSLSLFVVTPQGYLELVQREEEPGYEGTPLGQGAEEILSFVELIPSARASEGAWTSVSLPGLSPFRAFFPFLAPMFGFTALYEDDNPDPVYFLERSGTLSQQGLGTFFSTVSTESYSPKNTRLSPIRPVDGVHATLGLVSILFDNNWRRASKDANSISLGYYNATDAQLSVETYDRAEAEAAGVHSDIQFLFATVFRRSGEIEFDHYFVKEVDQGIQLGAFVQIRPGVWNYQEYRIWERTNDYLVVNFFCLADPFWINRRYFRQVLDSIQLVDR